MLKKERAAFILERLTALYPETPVPLDHKDNFSLLVAVLLSAQCTDERVNKVTPALFDLADNPFDMQHVPSRKHLQGSAALRASPTKIFSNFKIIKNSCRPV